MTELKKHTYRPRWLDHFFGDFEWKIALLHAVPTMLFVLALLTYWFAIANRYAVFLYGHLGATPFDDVTSSRYWMAGLVACGAVMVLYVLAQWSAGRIMALRNRSYHPPAWWCVWVLCVPSLAIGIPGITMTLNSPTLPLASALACLLATLTALALALVPGAWAARRPLHLGWLTLDGIGLMPTLLLLRAVELPTRGVVNIPVAYIAAIGGMLAGSAWLGGMTGLRRWRRKATPGASQIFVTGLCLSYLLTPLAHHLLATPPGYRYITTSSNFFAFSIWVQVLTFAIAAGLALGITKLRRVLLPQPAAPAPRHESARASHGRRNGASFDR